jgi:hypothetical protein
MLLLTLQVRSDPKSIPLLNTLLTQQKLWELKILAAFSFPDDAHKILEWINFRLRQGDEGFLNDKLDQKPLCDQVCIVRVNQSASFRAMLWPIYSHIFQTVVVSATIPPPFGRVLFYLNTAWMYNNQHASNDEKE